MTAARTAATHDVVAPDAEYILPLRWSSDSGLAELSAYLRHLVDWIPVTVVDGSDRALIESHRAAFPPAVRLIPPDQQHVNAAAQASGDGRGSNGKVAGVMAGVRASEAEFLVIADDDVRYTREALAAVVHHLRSADVVRPQNYFAPLPWHARWDTARTLLNRACSADYPGTLAVRRSALLATDGYAGVLFENLELIRTIKAAGGTERVLPGLFVAFHPATRPAGLRRLRPAAAAPCRVGLAPRSCRYRPASCHLAAGGPFGSGGSGRGLRRSRTTAG